MSKARLAALAVTLLAAGGIAFQAASPASATSLTCTNTQSATTAPYGCGGLQIAPGYKGGTLDLTADNTQNDQVVVQPDSVQNNQQDFTVFALNEDVSCTFGPAPLDVTPSPSPSCGTTGDPQKITGGPGDLGEYVAMVTPLGKIANFTITSPGASTPGCVSAAGSYSNAVPCAGATFTVGPTVYCLSVAQYKGFNGKVRWWVVQRDCNTNGPFVYGSLTTVGTVSGGRANHWQLWGPVQGPQNTGLGLVNVDLWNKNNVEYNLNISGMLGAGTPVQAYPNTGWSANQEWRVIGCTPPVSSLVANGQIPASYDLC
jgi:hypothetical protein